MLMKLKSSNGWMYANDLIKMIGTASLQVLDEYHDCYIVLFTAAMLEKVQASNSDCRGMLLANAARHTVQPEIAKLVSHRLAVSDRVILFSGRHFYKSCSKCL
jgi:hypothetical protein